MIKMFLLEGITTCTYVVQFVQDNVLGFVAVIACKSVNIIGPMTLQTCWIPYRFTETVLTVEIHGVEREVTQYGLLLKNIIYIFRKDNELFNEILRTSKN